MEKHCQLSTGQKKYYCLNDAMKGEICDVLLLTSSAETHVSRKLANECEVSKTNNKSPTESSVNRRQKNLKHVNCYKEGHFNEKMLK